MPNHRHQHKLSPKQFERLLEGRRFKPRSRRVARLVMVEGMTYAEAGAQAAMSKQQAWNIVSRLTSGDLSARA